MLRKLALSVIVLALSGVAAAQAPPSARAQLVMLGTGNPNADPDRSGPSVAIVVNGSAYLVDSGPGVVRRAAAAARRGISALAAPNLKVVFLTHLHSDHTLGLPDLIFSPWTLGRTEPLKVFGPKGTRAMTRDIEHAWRQDIDMRLHGGEPSNKTGYAAEAADVKPGVVYRDANVTVTAFAVPHGSWKQALAYRFDTRVDNKPDRSIVISGDTTYAPALAQACNACDLLVHEVYSQSGWEKRTPDWRAYHARFHTSSGDLARLATQARPGLLILYHQMPMGVADDELLREVQRGYSGKVVSAQDLDVF